MENPSDSYDGIGNRDIIPNHICRVPGSKLFKETKSILFFLWIWLKAVGLAMVQVIEINLECEVDPGGGVSGGENVPPSLESS